MGLKINIYQKFTQNKLNFVDSYSMQVLCWISYNIIQFTMCISKEPATSLRIQGILYQSVPSWNEQHLNYP